MITRVKEDKAQTCVENGLPDSDKGPFDNLDEQGVGELIQTISKIMDNMIKRNDQQRRKLSAIYLGFRACYDATYFVQRFIKYSHASPSCVILGYHYLVQLLEDNDDLELNSFSIQRLLLVVLMLGYKSLEDFEIRNSFWAKIGGFDKSEVNALELDVLRRLGFRLHASPADYARLIHQLQTCPEASARPSATPSSSQAAPPTPRPHSASLADYAAAKPVATAAKPDVAAACQNTAKPVVTPTPSTTSSSVSSSSCRSASSASTLADDSPSREATPASATDTPAAAASA
eukprot:CAMPEP_0113697554 /NCGR_PEP_ID=MMETSP0038_2-20120614/22197_1 /TAXON_ID=2898 /ORGANISM="Cryptomonas paramecium" /LENGTH=288 /DNA_ID=CAMNT_0000620575 /DNA_START=1 /DNA_END=863 /DNA_ORIENTATION=+ /assembly_acc=CAM_ASM_000170